MSTSLGVNFWGALEKYGQQNLGQILPEKCDEKFAGNFPKIRWTKSKNSPQIRSAEPQDQQFLLTLRTLH